MGTSSLTSQERQARISDDPRRESVRVIRQALSDIQATLETVQRGVDRADIAIESALDDPGAFLHSERALTNLDRTLRDVTGNCDRIVGSLGMIHHVAKESGMHSGLHVNGALEFQARTERLATRWVASQSRYFFTVLATGADPSWQAQPKLEAAVKRLGWSGIEVHDESDRRASARYAFNKFNPTELLGQIKKVLIDAGLNDVWQHIEAARLPRMIDEAWRNREQV